MHGSSPTLAPGLFYSSLTRSPQQGNRRQKFRMIFIPMFFERQASMSYQLFYRIIIVLCALVGMSGCTSYRDLPSGTHQRVTGKPEPDVIREAVDISPNPLPALSPVQTNDYIVGPNDILYVAVNGRTEFDGAGTLTASYASPGSNTFKGYRIDGRGNIYLPLVGKVAVSGVPLAEVRERIDLAIRQYFNNPSVVIEIAEYRTRQVFIFGAVKKPGPYPMPASGVNLAQLVSSADVSVADSKFRQLRIIRSNSPTQGELLVVDFDKVLRGEAVPLQLQEGDIVFVPKSKIGSWNEVISELLPSLQAVSATLQPFVNIKYLRQ
jgi:polysaccharide export outer membrane protein